MGGEFFASGSTTSNYGVSASATGGGANYAVYSNGNSMAVGGTWQTSDSILKTQITSIENPISTIKQLKPKSFYFDTTNTYGLNFTSKKQYGFLAQNVNQILPELINPFYSPIDSSHTGTLFSAINYNAFIGLLTAGMQQQQLSIDSLRNNPTAGPSLGNTCGGTQNPLTDNYEIPLGGHDLNFTDTANSVSRIMIGRPTCGGGKGRVNVFSDYYPTTGAFYNTANSTGTTYAIVASNNNNSGDAIGLVAQGSTFGNFSSIGLKGIAVGGAQSIGLNGIASNAITNYGVYATSFGGTTNYAGYFNGDVVRTGSDNFTSDANLKQNIDTIPNALNTIMQLKPKTFTYKQSSYPSMNLPGGKQYGLIAQEVQPLLPELINNTVHPAVKDSLGNVLTPAVNYLSLEYQQLTAIMIKAMQQQQAQIDSMKAILTSCCSNNSRTAQNNSAIDVELSDADIVVLNQNSPNPFAEQTTITYTIPKNTGAAQILFYDINGRQIKTVDISKKGKGQLNVYANDLTNGIYSYTLIVDGKIIDTKKMLKQQ